MRRGTPIKIPVDIQISIIPLVINNLPGKPVAKRSNECSLEFQRRSKSEGLIFNSYAAGGKFCKYKMMQKNWKMTETPANGYSSESTQ